MPIELDSTKQDFAAAFDAFLDSAREAEADVDATVATILNDVKARGDAALLDYTKKFDGMDLNVSRLQLEPHEIADAANTCDGELIKALELAAQRIEDYHRRQLPTDNRYVDAQGVTLGARWMPIESAGLYVPGGTAAYPSSVLMNAIPARVAGVERLAMVVPAPDGEINPLVLAAAKIIGIETVYRIGGAQAIAALAFGTQTVAQVDKIAGPGNAYVAAAKRRVFGTVGIDMIAGPSEILIVADKENDPDWIAIDLLSQAEHDPLARSVLITDDARFATAVMEAVVMQLKTLPRAEIARKSWNDHGAVITVGDLNEAVVLIDAMAPEHVELAVAKPEKLEERVRNAGAIFLGRFTPGAIGDYIAGPNHVLPTSRSARFSSGLSVYDFLTRISLVGCDADSLKAIGPAAVTLAQAEGLDAHAQSVAIRLNTPLSK